MIRRLEGARGEAVVAAPASPTTAAFPAPAPSRPVSSTVPAPREKGRWDGWVMGTGAVAGVALLAGGYFGYRAWSDRLGDAPSTGSSTTFANLQNQADRAHREAVFADVGFGVALAAGATSALLYFLRDKPSDHPVDRAAMVPSVVVLPGGATAGLRVGF